MLKKLSFALSLAAAVSGMATYWALSYTAPLSEKTGLVVTLVYCDVIFLLLLAVVISKRLVELWLERRRGSAGSKLHIHIVTLFSIVAVTPAICVAVFSALFFDSRIEAWFGKPVKDALQEARIVAEAYLQEHQKAIKIDAHSLVSKLRPHMESYLQDPFLLSQVLSNEADERGVGELLVFNGKGEVIARSYLTFALELEKILLNDFDKVRANEIVVREGKDRVRALIKLDALTDTYLFVGKLIDPDVLSHLSRTQNSLQTYYLLAQQHSGAQLTFIVFFCLIALLLLLSAIWGGLNLANYLVEPIGRLIAAAEEVSRGNLSIKVAEGSLNNELDDLMRSFNHMTHRLLQQNQELIITQRKAAWSDVARRIAHEIKNPLTPIQLSAERLKRRYLKEIASDPQTFQNCIDTIIRQVSYIGNLVAEFTSFARMPDPKLISTDLFKLIQEAVFMEKQAHPHIDFIYNTPSQSIMWLCDPQQISQVLTNLLQNSILAIIEDQKYNSNKKGLIHLEIHQEKNQLSILIEDNGLGFPKENRERLLEPYYTTREQGTGLGLAIVSKIVNDHNGHLSLGNSKIGGACVQLTFKRL